MAETSPILGDLESLKELYRRLSVMSRSSSQTETPAMVVWYNRDPQTELN
jgi:hypothetical protein